jgi:ribosome biogenesis GTPase
MFLERLGADRDVYGAFHSHAQQQFTLARVAIAQHDLCYLYTEEGPVHATVSGALYYQTPAHLLPVTGDWVATRSVAPQQSVIEEVLPRRTCLSRRAAGTRHEEQPLASNVDVVFLVCGLDGDFNLRRLERYLALTASSGALPVVVLNKTDVCSDLDGRIFETAAVARNAPIVPASTIDPHGLDALRGFLRPGATVALLGSSGVGKSTIANRLLGEERFRTRDVRMWDSRGRHTTVRRELTPLPESGALIDTPGLRELQLWVSPESVDHVFDDIAAIAEGCRFRNCRHMGEPGCAVAVSLERGEMDAGRWASFQKLRAEAEWHESLSNPLTAIERKRKWKSIHKQARAFHKSRR